MGSPGIASPGTENVRSRRPTPLSYVKASAREFSSWQGLRLDSAMNPVQSSPKAHRAFIALGSNVGDRIEMIETACLEMDRANIKVKRTSSLFETTPMYVLEQATFMNGVCEVIPLGTCCLEVETDIFQVETTLAPMELLDALQSIEIALGRKKLIEKGPRSIDLDILLYDQEVFSHERLNVPHKLMLERDFVLRPLCQYVETPYMSIT